MASNDRDVGACASGGSGGGGVQGRQRWHGKITGSCSTSEPSSDVGLLAFSCKKKPTFMSTQVKRGPGSRSESTNRGRTVGKANAAAGAARTQAVVAKLLVRLERLGSWFTVFTIRTEAQAARVLSFREHLGAFQGSDGCKGGSF